MPGLALPQQQDVGSGRDVFVLPLPAVVSVREGLNLPRYPSVPGRLRAQRKPLDSRSPERPGSRLEMLRLIVPEGEGKQAEILVPLRMVVAALLPDVNQQHAH